MYFWALLLLAAAAVDRTPATRALSVAAAAALLFYAHRRDGSVSEHRVGAWRAALDALPVLDPSRPGGRRKGTARFARLRDDVVLLRAFAQFLPLKRYDAHILASAATAIEDVLRRRGAAAAAAAGAAAGATTEEVLNALSEFAFAVPADALARFNFTGKLRALDVVLARELRPAADLGFAGPAAPSDPYAFTGSAA